MRKPFTFTDGVNNWTVEFCLLPDEDDTLCEETCEVPTIDRPGLLRVKGDMAPRQVLQALMHGMTHCAEHTEAILLDESEYHVRIDRMCRWFVTVLHLNPKLRDFFFRALTK